MDSLLLACSILCGGHVSSLGHTRDVVLTCEGTFWFTGLTLFGTAAVSQLVVCSHGFACLKASADGAKFPRSLTLKMRSLAFAVALTRLS